MKSSILVSSVLLIYLLPGCSSDSEEQASPGSTGGSSQPVFQDQINALDKAKGLEQDMNKAFEQRTQEMESQTQ